MAKEHFSHSVVTRYLTRRRHLGAQRDCLWRSRLGIWFHPTRAVAIVLWSLLFLNGFIAASVLMFPYTVGRHVISDGSRTVVFEGLVHLGSSDFYNSVVEDITREKARGATLFYEGVRSDPQDPGAERKVYTAISSPSGRNPIPAFASILGVQNQDTRAFVGHAGGPDVNVDVTFTEMAAHLDAAETAPSGLIPWDSVADVLSYFPWPLRAEIHFLARGVMGIKGWVDGLSGPQAVAQQDAVVGFRNKRLADAILSGPTHIVVSYGETHFTGLLMLLQQANPHWVEIEATRRNVLTSTARWPYALVL